MGSVTTLFSRDVTSCHYRRHGHAIECNYKDTAQRANAINLTLAQ